MRSLEPSRQATFTAGPSESHLRTDRSLPEYAINSTKLAEMK